jgi:transcriptional regulator with XRE-family HTH domain
MASSAQLRAGRALLGMSQAEIAEATGLSTITVKRAEEGVGFPVPSSEILEKIRAVLESHGVEFIAENGGGPGVRLRKRGPNPATIPVEDLNAENDE